MTTPPPPVARPAPSRRTRPRRGRLVLGGAALAVAGLGLVGVAVDGLVTDVGKPVTVTLTSPEQTAPMDRVMQLQARRYTVFELVGRVTRRGSVTRTQRVPPTIDAGAVNVVDAERRPVPVSGPGTVTETLTRGDLLYQGVARFEIPTAGLYRVVVAAHGLVVVAPSLSTSFGAGAGWIGLGLGGAVLLLAGGAVLVLGLTRGRSTPLPAAAGFALTQHGPVPATVGRPTPGMPPPGWYPDPQQGTGLRWWDGSVWTEHVHRADPPVSDAGPWQQP